MGRTRKQEKKIEAAPLKIDPLVIDMPSFRGEFRRFDKSKDGQRLFVVYEIVAVNR